MACGVIPGKSPLVDRLKIASITVHSINSLSRDVDFLKDIKSFFEIIKVVKKNRPDIVHLHSSKIGGLGALAARICGVKTIVFTAHGTPFKEDRFFVINFILRIFSYITVILAHKTICVSNSVYNSYPKLFVSKKCFVVHNGISEGIYLERQFAQEKLNIKTTHGELVIGTISELHPNKGLLYLCKAVKMLYENGITVWLHILGGGEQRTKLADYIEKNDLTGQIFLHGFIADASSYLKAFDVFVLSSINEGLPYVLLEAGLAELAVVATDVGGVPEIIEDNRTGLLVKSKSPAEIKKAIELLVKNDILRSDLSKGLKDKVENEYSLEKMLGGILSVYRKQ